LDVSRVKTDKTEFYMVFDAEKARSMTDAAQPAKQVYLENDFHKRLADAMKDIEKAAKAGEFECHFIWRLRIDVRAVLRVRGFRVEERERMDVVMWDIPPEPEADQPPDWIGWGPKTESFFKRIFG
jgi:hypothetical protein